MIVRDFMKTDVITVDIKTPIMAALEIMKTNKIKRLPVIKNKHFVGLVTRAMIRDASPSSATSLSIYELNYLVSKMTVGEIMVKDPLTISPDLPVEEVIALGEKHGIGGFPVVENHDLVGIVTASDLASLVSSALGVGDKKSKRITIDASGKRFGYLKGLIEVLDRHHAPLMSIMSIPKPARSDWFLVLRVKTEDATAVTEDLKKEGFQVTLVS